VTAGAYVALLRTRGVARLAGAFLTLGMGNTMTPVALVLFARSATHSFAKASVVLAASTAGGLVFGPARGRLIDRVRARTAVLRLATPDVLTDDATRQAGFALMTMLQETSFIAGPLLAAALIGLWSSTAAVVGTTVLSGVGAIVCVTSAERGEVHPRCPDPRDRASRLAAVAGQGIRTVLAGFGLTSACSTWPSRRSPAPTAPPPRPASCSRPRGWRRSSSNPGWSRWPRWQS
jgi:hypothetical protein